MEQPKLQPHFYLDQQERFDQYMDLKELLLQEIRKNPACKFYLGGYGDFDSLCLNILKEMKADFPTIELLFITPYLDDNYSKLETAKLYYDSIIYPPLENVPRRFWISKRNEWMVDEADLVIAFVKYSFLYAKI